MTSQETKMRILSSSSDEKFYLDEECYDKLGLIKFGERVFRNNQELPDELSIKGNLFFQDLYKPLYLPKKKLIVNGTLKIYWSNIMCFPKIIAVSNSLDLSEVKPVEKIKIQSLIVKGPLCRIVYCKIKEIGYINVSGDLDFSSTTIDKLPNGLIVKKDLIIPYTNLVDDTFHESWQVKGTLYCNQEQFQKNFSVCKKLLESKKVANFQVI